MKLSDRIELLFLAFLGHTRIIDLKKLILQGKLKLSPSMAYEFSAAGLATILINEVKRIVEILPSKTKSIIYTGAREAGRESILLLKERFKGSDSVYNLEKALNLTMKCFGMKGGWKGKISEKETIGYVTKCPFSKLILKEKVPETCMICEGFCQGVADIMAKGSTVSIPMKMSKGDKYCKFIASRKIPIKEPYLEMEMKFPLDFIHGFTVRELGRILVKMGKRAIKVTSPKTYRAILFWGARDSGREVGKMMKRLGIKDGLNAVEAGTVFFAQSSRMKRVQIKISEKENIGHVFVCPWARIAIKDNIPEACMICEGFCQGVADIMAKGSTVSIPMKMSKGDEYCKFVYRKVK